MRHVMVQAERVVRTDVLVCAVRVNRVHVVQAEALEQAEWVVRAVRMGSVRVVQAERVVCAERVGRAERVVQAVKYANCLGCSAQR